MTRILKSAINHTAQAYLCAEAENGTPSGVCGSACGHLGLTPQSVNKIGGYGLRAKEEAEAERVTQYLSIPTIGIGAGSATDGQVLVVQDMLGMNDGFKPKFMRYFGHIGEAITS